MSQPLLTHTDDECEDLHCPLHSDRNFKPVHANGVGPKQCSECGFQPIRMIGSRCEPCHYAKVVTPAVERWNSAVAEMDGAHTQLSEALGGLTQSSASDNFNMNITCQCGKIYNSGIAMFKHLPDCEGPKPKTVHRTVTQRAIKIDLKNFKIG